MIEVRDPRSVKLEPCSVLVARFLPLHAAVFGTLVAIDRPGWMLWTLALALWGSAIIAVRHTSVRALSLLFCICVAAASFPRTPNHGYVLCFALGIGGLFRTEEPGERTVLEAGYRHLAAIVLFWSGVQKLCAGTWLHGQYFAYLLGHSGRFGIWGWMVSRPERYALQGNGPFLGNTMLAVLSNAVWIGEVAIGLGLLSSNARIRNASAILALFLVVGIELGAREATFGVIMLALVLPATNVRFRAAWLWLLVPLELLAMGGRWGLVPGGFH